MSRVVTRWDTRSAEQLQRQLDLQTADFDRRIALLERERRGGPRNAGLDPVSVGPGEYARVESLTTKTIGLRAPAVEDIGQRCWVWKSNAESPLHIAANGCTLEGVADGVVSAQRKGMIGFLVIPSATPGRAEWAWLNDGVQVFGEIHLPNASSAATTIALVDTWYLAAGTTTLHDGDLMSSPSTWALQLDAYGTHEITFSAQLSIASAAPARMMRVAFALNGTVQTETEIQRWMSATDVGAVGLTGTFELTQGDIVDVRLLNETAASNFTITYGTVVASEAI